ncbi:hypothetical protein B566_EDAN005095 [Ephemera danica]|nr:hypothetical protein B566_EDAN005095 [Ephemera danica]
MLTEVAAFVVVLLVLWWSWGRSQRSDFVRKINLLPGPPTLPVFGNALVFILRNPVDLFTWIVKEVWPLGNAVRIWVFNAAQIGIAGARDAEPILRGTKFITKSDSYDFFFPWVGKGLLTADGDQWRKFRKILTPAFHFGILHEFLPIFVNHSLTMVERLSEEPAATSEQGFDISPYSSLCAFDIICESSMGAKVIAERRDYLKSLKQNREESEIDMCESKKRNMVFLDQLLTSEETERLSQEDIRSNVNVFMFAVMRHK